MDSEALLRLAERCEAATCDEQASLLIEAFDLTNWRSETRGQIIRHPRWSRFDKMVRAGAYESAAMMLAPEGWFALRFERHIHGTGCFLDALDTFAATPALALTAACLKALAKGQDHG